MDIRERIIRKTAIYFKENVLDYLCWFMENTLNYQRDCYRENLRALKKLKKIYSLISEFFLTTAQQMKKLARNS